MATSPPDQPPLFRASSIAVGLKIVSLLKRDIDIQYLDVAEPRVYLIVYPDGRTNVPEPKVKGERQRRWRRSSNWRSAGSACAMAFSKSNRAAARPSTRAGENLKSAFTYEPLGPRYRGTLSIQPLDLQVEDSAVDAVRRQPGGGHREEPRCRDLRRGQHGRLHHRPLGRAGRSHVAARLVPVRRAGVAGRCRAHLPCARVAARRRAGRRQRVIERARRPGRDRQPARHGRGVSRLHHAAPQRAARGRRDGRAAGYRRRRARASPSTYSQSRGQAPAEGRIAEIALRKKLLDICAELRSRVAGRQFPRRSAAARLAAVHGRGRYRRLRRPPHRRALQPGAAAVGRPGAPARARCKARYGASRAARLRRILRSHPPPRARPVTARSPPTTTRSSEILDLGRSTFTLPSSRADFSGVFGRELRAHLETTDLNDLLPLLGPERQRAAR